MGKALRNSMIGIGILLLPMLLGMNMIFVKGSDLNQFITKEGSNKSEEVTVSNSSELQTVQMDRNTNQIILQYKEKFKVGKKFRRYIAKKITYREKVSDTVEVIKTATSEDMEKLIKKFEKDEDIVYMEQDEIRKIQGTLDPDASKQWSLKNIEAEEAWGILPSQKKTVVVAVIDSGIEMNHPDLKNRIAAGGYNFISNIPFMYDTNGHGTEVAGIIAAETNNYIGIAGVAGTWNVRILPLQTADFDGGSYVSDEVKAIEYAIEKKVDVINLSLGGGPYSSIENEAIQRAINSGIIVVAAAGNENKNTYGYPASYENVISVGSIGENDIISDFSNVNDRIDVVAPGEEIYTCEKGNTYAFHKGTSYSAPIVSGIAAILKGIDPLIQPSEVRTILQQCAIDLGEKGKDDLYGYGKINLYNAVKLMSSVLSVTLNKERLSLNVDQSENLIAKVSPSSASNKNLYWTSSDSNVVSVDKDGIIIAKKLGNAIITANSADGEKAATCAVFVEAEPLCITASLGNGIYKAIQSVQLKASRESKIYYTLDGSEPSIQSEAYLGEISIKKTGILKYMAVDSNGISSTVFKAIYVVDNTDSEIFDLEENVSSDKEWKIKFNVEIDSATILSENIQVTDLQEDRLIGIDLNIEEGNKVVTVIPKEEYKKNKIYCLVITKGIKARLGGSNIEKPVKVYFTIKT